MPRQLLAALEGSDTSGDEDDGDNKPKQKQKAVRTKYDRMFERQNQDVLAAHYTKLIEDDDDEDQDEARGMSSRATNNNEDDENEPDFLSVKRRFVAGDEALGHGSSPSGSESDTEKEDLMGDPHGQIISDKAKPLIIDSHRREKLLSSRKKLLKYKYKGNGAHPTFESDSDTPKDRRVYRNESTFGPEAAQWEKEEFLEREREQAKQMDEVDKEIAWQKKREKKEQRKQRARELREQERMRDDEEGDDGDQGVQLVPYDEDRDQGKSVYDDDDEYRNDEKEERQPVTAKKRPKKWFEDASDSEDDDRAVKNGGGGVGKRKKNRKGAGLDVTEQPETLEDLEAMASGLLATGEGRKLTIWNKQ